MQLGTFDFSGFVPSRACSSRGPSSGRPHDTLGWPDGARHVYGRNFVAQTSSAISGGRIRGLRGSSLRCLHHTVFDVIDGSITGHSVRVGLGASVYGLVGRWAPRSLVSWIMGIRRVDELSAWRSSADEGVPRDDTDQVDPAIMSKEFVAVPSDHNVWNSDTAESSLWVPSVAESS